jgi:hypothetical protein
LIGFWLLGKCDFLPSQEKIKLLNERNNFEKALAEDLLEFVFEIIT